MATNTPMTADTIKVYSEGSVFWDGQEYKPDSDGIVELPELAVRHIESFGYAPANVFGKPIQSHEDTHKLERVGPKPPSPLPPIEEDVPLQRFVLNEDEKQEPKKAKAG